MEKPATQSENGIPVVGPRPTDQPPVLSIGQQRLWYLAQLAPDSGAYNIPCASRIKGALDVVALERALNAVVGRHEALRTVILAPGGTPVPVVLKRWPVKFKVIDLQHLEKEQRDREADRLLSEEASRPFNFARDVMVRGTVLLLAEQEYVFLLVAPHLAFEVSSVAVVYRDLSALYEGFLSGVPAQLPELRLQYGDFAVWQHSRLQGERLEALTAYWRDCLAGAPRIELPLDFPRPAIHTMRGTRHFWTMSSDLVEAIHPFFRGCGVSSYRGLYAAFNVFLHGYTGQSDFCMGSPFAPRCTGIENTVGFFVNTVVLRTRFSGGDTFRDVLKRADSVVRGAIEHSELTLDKLVEVVAPPRDPSRHPLFQVNFRAPKTPWPTLELRGLTAERTQYINNGTAKFDLALEIDSACGEACYFEFCADLFKKETIDQMVVDFQALLRGLIARPDVPLDQVSELMEISRRVRKNP